MKREYLCVYMDVYIAGATDCLYCNSNLALAACVRLFKLVVAVSSPPSGRVYVTSRVTLLLSILIVSDVYNECYINITI